MFVLCFNRWARNELVTENDKCTTNELNPNTHNLQVRYTYRSAILIGFLGMYVEGLKIAARVKFEDGDYKQAADLYSKAIEIDGNRSVLFSNRSVSFLNIGEIERALEDAKTCVKLKPKWNRGHFRMGQAFEKLEQFEDVGQFRCVRFPITSVCRAYEHIGMH